MKPEARISLDLRRAAAFNSSRRHFAFVLVKTLLGNSVEFESRDRTFEVWGGEAAADKAEASPNHLLDMFRIFWAGRTMRCVISIVVLLTWVLLASAETNPKDYPEKAKVLSFQEQPCMAGKILRACHVLTFEVGNQKLIASCIHCDPLVPGETYPARLGDHESVLYVLHQKGNKKWGKDNYAIIDISLIATDNKKP